MPKKESSEKEQTRDYSKRDKDKDRAASSSSSSRREGDKDREKERTRASFSDRDRLKKDMERDRSRRDTDRDRSRPSSDRKEASRKEGASADRDRENRHRDKHRDAVEAETKSPKSKKDGKEGRSSHSSSSKSSSSKDYHASSESSRRETSDTRQESSEPRRDKESRHSQRSSSDSKMKRPSLPSKHKSSSSIQPPKSTPVVEVPSTSEPERPPPPPPPPVKEKAEKPQSVEAEESAPNISHDDTTAIPAPPSDSAKEKVYATSARINAKSVTSMGTITSFAHNTEKINSLDYSADGRHMISSSFDDSITIYECLSGKTHRTTNSKKYGVDLIRFVRCDGSISNAIHCSTKVDNSIRHLSIDEIKYIRYFSGHHKPVTMLNMLDHSNIFISGSLDKTVRLWDLRTEKAQAQTTVASRPVGEFDQDGLIFGIGHSGNTIKLFDLRTFEKGPFASFVIQRENTSEISSLQFSPNGKSILLTTNGDECYLVDAFTGRLQHVLNEHKNPLNIPIDATFTPDGQFIFCGSSDGKLYTYQTSTGALLHSYTTDHQDAIKCVKFNPRYFILATACQKLNFWVPQSADP
ncbi:hypothetical protein QR680_002515 [Steinernema hermaphroditum]|uniref:Anaphase-promoting complex subunit 4 WD40 domain-containing protein n=1 Tax=Steinernema hermaphroditum TaxID=289476 RepID=A0AA39H552_9BILA|nr:hypothetical protein QR680_002515 [Steinernema hermaphroditum]